MVKYTAQRFFRAWFSINCKTPLIKLSFFATATYNYQVFINKYQDLGTNQQKNHYIQISLMRKYIKILTWF